MTETQSEVLYIENAGDKLSKLIEKEASLALTGAEYVREKLIALAGLGPNSLYDQTYAIKVRVKSLDSLKKKVIKKKKEPTKKTYKAEDATDLVGMRLLCLYGEDLPRVTKSLISFVRFCQSPEIRLIEGETLDEAFHEVIVYKSNRNARVYDTVFKSCGQLGLSEKNKKNEEKLKIVAHEGDSKSYSSIHFVCNGISYASGQPKRVPIEFQVRTIFEDTWGEIDHGLEYKLKEKIGRRLPPKLVPTHENYRGFLNDLKGYLEDAGQLAERIKSGYDSIYIALNTQKQKEKSFQVRTIFWGYPFEKSLNNDDLKRLPETIDLAFLSKQLDDIRTAVSSPIDNEAEGVKLLKRIDENLSLLDDCLTKIPGQDESAPDFFSEPTFQYFLSMEKALHLLWKSEVSKFYFPLSVEENINFAERARDIYFKLEKITKFSLDAMLNFRIGCTMQVLGQNELAGFFMDNSINYLPDDGNVAQSMFSFIIPHHYAYSVWRKRAVLLGHGIASQNPRINRDEQREIVLEALYYSLVASFFIDVFDQDSVPRLPNMKHAISNNIISFLWEARDLSYSTPDFENEISMLLNELKTNFQNYKGKTISEFQTWLGKTEVDLETAHYYDTMMKYHHLLGNVDKVNEFRELARAKIEEKEEKQKEKLDDLYTYAQERTVGREHKYEMANRDMIF